MQLSAAERSVAPGENLQHAIDAAQSGDVLVLDEGTYFGCVRINKPLTIRAKTPGAVTLTNAARTAPTFRPEGTIEGMYLRLPLAGTPRAL